MWNLFKVNNEDAGTTSLKWRHWQRYGVIITFLLTWNGYHALPWGFFCWLQVNAGWVYKYYLHLNLRSQSISICIRNEKISGCKIWESCLKLTFMTRLPFLNKRKSKFCNQTEITQNKHHTQLHKMNPAQMIFKVWFSPSKKYCVICFIESPLKRILFISMLFKSSFRSQDI